MISEQGHGDFAKPDVRLTDDLVKSIERVFLSDDAIDPGSRLLAKICPPHKFPYDTMGKLLFETNHLGHNTSQTCFC